MMTSGLDKWQAFCEATESWRMQQEGGEQNAEEDFDVVAEDEPEDDDDEIELGDGENVVPTGFEATGEFSLLMRERRIRGELRHTAEIGGDNDVPLGWEADQDEASSEATWEYHPDVDQSPDGVPMSAEEEPNEGREESMTPGEEPDEEEQPAASRKRGLVDPKEAKKASDVLLWGDRYFERQQEMKCGRHAVNNLIGGPQFIDQDLEGACEAVCLDTGDDVRQHIAPQGWYSMSVLASLIDMTVPPLGQLLLKPCAAEAYHLMLQGDDYYGCLVNQRNLHWACVVKHNGRLFYVDSCYYPTEIDFPDFQGILRSYPMTFLIEKHGEP
jgi:hypothetical protein